MLDAGLRLVRSLAVLGAEVTVDAGRLIGADDLFDIRPRQFRRLLLTLDDSIQGRIPQILGDDEEERVETLVRLLRGTSEKDLSVLIGDLQEALIRLHHERRRTTRSASGPWTDSLTKIELT
jgi:hypothetical protein